MTAEGFKRKLTVVFSADVSGYGRLMGENEAATVKCLEEYKGVMFTLIKQHRGRVIDSPGDNLLAEFGSVVDAVQCAVAVQKELHARNMGLPENRRMLFRIGINLGDVIEEQDRIYGDGVNIAARLEGLADPGGICISKTAFDHIESKLPLGYQYLGEQTVKNIAKPIGAYRVMMESRVTGIEKKEIGRASEEKMAYPLPDKPSIAVLPFTNMSGDPSQDYIGDGLSENIISALSLSSRIFVIARNSTFTYKGKPVKVQQVAEDLGVQYVLEGSIQKAGDQLRVTAQLIDALNGYHLWSEKYDRKMEKLFDLQDEITKKIVVSLRVELIAYGGEDLRVLAKSTENLDAWIHYIKGLELTFKFKKEDNLKAREHFMAALKFDPEYVSAMAFLSNTYYVEGTFGWSDSPPNSFKRAFELAQKALEIDERHATVHGLLARIYLFQRQYEKAIDEGKQAITLNPNYATGYGELGFVMLYIGKFDEAIALIKEAFRLNPELYPFFLTFLKKCYIFNGQYEEALEVCNQMEERASKGNLADWIPPFEFSQVYQELGREEEARAFMAEALKINPNLSLQYVNFFNPYKESAHLQRELDAFRKTGLPEKPGQVLQEKPSIAVLPFVNMSNDPEQEYFSDGMTEELISALAKLEDLKVISRTSAFYFKGKDVDLRSIGEKLKVDNVLEGSVRKAGHKLRITAQLIKVEDDTHLWSESYNRELVDVFDIQEEISQAIVKNLKVKLLGTKTEPLVKDDTKSAEAYELYLKGVYFENKDLSNWDQARKYYEMSIQADPIFVPPYAKLAHNLIKMIPATTWPPDEVYPKIRELVLKALEVDDKYALTYVPVGALKMFQEYDWNEAEKAYKRGIDLNPGLAELRTDYSVYLSAVDRIDEAIVQINRALELDPISIWIRMFRGMYLCFAHQFDRTIDLVKKDIEFAPKDPLLLEPLVAAYAEKGMYDEAVSRLQPFSHIPLHAAHLGWQYAKGDKREEAWNILNDCLERSAKGYFSPYMIAGIYAGLGEKDKIFEWLDKAYEKHDSLQWTIRNYYWFTDLHSDPRWSAVLKKRGLAN